MVRNDEGRLGRGEPIQINTSKQLLVEGWDEVHLFRVLLSSLGISDVDVHPYQGHQQLRPFLRTFVGLANFSTVNALGVIADAEFNPGATRDRIRGALRDVGLPVPNEPLVPETQNGLRVVYLVLPHGADQGMLENTCLDSVEVSTEMECVNQFMACVSGKKPGWPSQNIAAKAKVRAFLASLDPPDLRLGEAAERGFWDFTSAAFDPLKELLGIVEESSSPY